MEHFPSVRRIYLESEFKFYSLVLSLKSVSISTAHGCKMDPCPFCFWPGLKAWKQLRKAETFAGPHWWSLDASSVSNSDSLVSLTIIYLVNVSLAFPGTFPLTW